MIYDRLKLEKGLYTTGKGFTKSLEELDPSENYIGTELEGLDAYQRQLKRFDIKVSGAGSDSVSKFFQTTDSSVLFPEYVSRAVKQGFDEANCLDDIVATTTNIDSLDYRTIEGIVIAENNNVSDTVIKTKESLIPLKKRGSKLITSYEAIKYQRLDLFTVILKKIGVRIAKAQLDDVVNELCNGNMTCIKSTDSTYTYRDFVKLSTSIYPYNTTTFVVPIKDIPCLFNMPDFKNSDMHFSFPKEGKIVTPLGINIVISNSIEQNNILALDKNYAVEKVTVGGINTDFENLIDRQFEKATISEIAGFSQIFKDAACLFDIKYL